ncbi:MAG: rRNA maturation RNase YbeY [Chloroflexi bacterium]|nr:rRNA maturation RNase YbeY [Chloroflexota bacterium]
MNHAPSPLPNVTVAVQSDDLEDCVGVPAPEWLAAAVRHGLAQALPADTVGQVSLLITDDATVRELNRQYRGLDETTDVLSFSAEHGGHWEGTDTSSPLTGEGWGENEPPGQFPIPDDEPPPIGDIVVSLPYAARQAEQQGIPLCRELALLLVHGALHLLGHDHYDDGERAEMQQLERLALDAFSSESGFTGSYHRHPCERTSPRT